MEAKVFKTEEERQKAINEIPEEPPENIKGNFEKEQEWNKKTQEDLQVLMSAKIDPEVVTPEVKKEAEGVKPDLSKPPSEVEDLKRQLDVLRNERLQLQDETRRMSSDYDSKMEQLMKEMNELKEQLKNPPKPKEAEKDFEMEVLEAELKTATDEIKDIDKDEDRDAWDKVINKKIDIGNKINLLIAKRHKEELSASRTAIQKMKEDARKEAEENAKKREEEKKENEYKQIREQTLKEVHQFKSNHKDEFKSEANYEQMFDENDRFYEQVAADYWGKPAYKVTRADKELAVKRYKENREVLKPALTAKGIKEPASFDEYDILSTLYRLRRGYYDLDESTGQFKPYLDPSGYQVIFPDMDAAYDHLKKKTGRYNKDLMEAQRAGAKAAVAAMSQRVNPMELDEGQQKQYLETETKPEEALEMLQKKDSQGNLIFDEDKMADLAIEANKAGKPMPAIVREYNKYMKAINQPAIEEVLRLS